MGTANSKDGNAKQQHGNAHVKPGGLSALAHNLPGPLSLKEYKSRLATSDGSQTLYFSQSGLKVKYAFVSQRGLYPSAPDKPNQDSLCVHTHYGGDPESAFFGIFDGHGEFGTECSQFAKDKVPENLLNSPHILVQPEKAFRQAMVHTNKQLHRQPKDDVDDSMSGTTAIALLLKNRQAR
ncbi:phosphatase 2C-like domain-containing protein [Dunaliella salina]|uniref:protein-serine/threonine phosphatase n=1 Tax=Dunaliella salina TaxID=3046 RepID=A0ABQ7GQX9_DUNSA|nr:phosphatase 2C-like domain-containing protein [Dunaliella salina]|eukprot:KAF5836999.1 phosphatase 2C-like domain-containing protein [Dunaliella salina]